MTGLVPSSRVLFGTCICLFALVVVVGGAVSATIAPTSDQGVSQAGSPATAGKIGPGYARMQPAHFGKPDKVAYSAPYHPGAALPSGPVNKRSGQASIAKASIAKTSIIKASPRLVAAIVPSSNNSSDFRRVY